MKSERQLLITISCGDERCGFCVYRATPGFCVLFAKPLNYVKDGSAPASLLRCAECVEAEQKVSGKQ